MSVPDHPVHELVKKTGIHPPCWNNRKPLLSGYYAEDRYYQKDGRWSRIMVWIGDDWLDGGRCQQPGVGYKPDPTCVGCEELKQ